MPSLVQMMRKMNLGLMHSSCICKIFYTALYIYFNISCMAFVLFLLPCMLLSYIAHFFFNFSWLYQLLQELSHVIVHAKFITRT